MDNKKLSIIIPMYNEEESLPYLYKRLVELAKRIDKYQLEFLFVNDGSKDNSLKIVKEYRKKDSRVQYLNLSRNFGKEVAMGAAFDYVTGDVVVIIDADLQDPPELIVDMLKFYEQGYDDVYAKRRNRKGETWLKKFTSKAFYRVLESVSNVPIQKDTGDFRLLSRRAIEALKAFPEKQRYTKGMFSLIGFKKKEIEYDRDPRVAGSTKWNYFKLMDLAIEGITSFTTAPLRIATIIGVLSAIGSFIYMIFTIVKTVVYGVDVPGYASLICILLMLGGIQLICLGLIGEYIGRIFIEVKGRPLYFVDEYSGNIEENQDIYKEVAIGRDSTNS
ncbi:glycosyltransferase family 2 protein [Clostridium celatum]|uniref:Putative bactoprenol glucosyl transferase-like protein n=1 Tax=Clostridium celatum DSM 1785 TaxID=545697 RepID=L1QMP4_9CLOT|nr:glycosyltransferase family 2 protein [Clostridium celatum]EKY28985.1 putative bactoprenol glucosyl transferase-like protein [Clostridium celatum DSM 1785]MCE9654448.1 glycosyltransferase family 2 protein [Clostridium celatum]